MFKTQCMQCGKVIEEWEAYHVFGQPSKICEECYDKERERVLNDDVVQRLVDNACSVITCGVTDDNLMIMTSIVFRTCQVQATPKEKKLIKMLGRQHMYNIIKATLIYRDVQIL